MIDNKDYCYQENEILYVCNKRAQEIKEDTTKSEENYPYCKWCGAFIQDAKVISEGIPLVLRNGGTWLCFAKGVDYLAMDPAYKDCTIGEMKNYFKAHLMDLDNPKGLQYFKPIDQIEFEGITDEIAKLRPMVINSSNTTYQLWGVTNKDTAILKSNCFNLKNIRLVRYSDLIKNYKGDNY